MPYKIKIVEDIIVLKVEQRIDRNLLSDIFQDFSRIDTERKHNLDRFNDLSDVREVQVTFDDLYQTLDYTKNANIFNKFRSVSLVSGGLAYGFLKVLQLWNVIGEMKLVIVRNLDDAARILGVDRTRLII